MPLPEWLTKQREASVLTGRIALTVIALPLVCVGLFLLPEPVRARWGDTEHGTFTAVYEDCRSGTARQGICKAVGHFVVDGTTRRESAEYSGVPRPKPGTSVPGVRVPGSQTVYEVGNFAWLLPAGLAGVGLYSLYATWTGRWDSRRPRVDRWRH